MTTIEVACAIIHEKDRFLIAQRMPGDSFGGMWEFPGGKKRKSESHEACLVREAHEELNIHIAPYAFWGLGIHLYPTKRIRISFYLCDYLWGVPVRRECHSFRWVGLADLRRYCFLPADIDVINKLLRSRYFLINRTSRRRSALS